MRHAFNERTSLKATLPSALAISTIVGAVIVATLHQVLPVYEQYLQKQAKKRLGDAYSSKDI